VFAPHGPHLFVSRKLAAGGGGLRSSDGGAFLGRERHRRRLIICSGKPENNAGDIVLSVRRKTARGLNCSVEEFCHSWIVKPPMPKNNNKMQGFFTIVRGTGAAG
jgi:hypothetical protein